MIIANLLTSHAELGIFKTFTESIKSKDGSYFNMKKKIAILMGSDSDYSVVKETIETIESFGVPLSVHIISAHHTSRLLILL